MKLNAVCITAAHKPTCQILFYFILFYFILFYFILFYFVLFCFVLFYIKISVSVL